MTAKDIVAELKKLANARSKKMWMTHGGGSAGVTRDAEKAGGTPAVRIAATEFRLVGRHDGLRAAGIRRRLGVHLSRDRAAQIQLALAVSAIRAGKP